MMLLFKFLSALRDRKNCWVVPSRRGGGGGSVHYVVEVICLLIRFKKSKPFLWNTKNTDRNGINDNWEKETHHKQRER